MKLIFLVLLVASLSFSCERGLTSSVVSAEEKAIREVRERFNQAIALHDTVSIAGSWTNDYLMVTSRNAEVHGKENARKKFADEFKLRPDVVYVRSTHVIQIFEAWKMASEEGEWTGTWKDESGDDIETGGTYFAKWHKVDGRWLIRTEVFVPLRCEGGKFCEQSPI